MPTRDLIVIGASAGGVDALSALMKELPRELPAAVCIVWHLASRSRNLLPQILTRVGRLPVTLATDGAALQPGHVYIAPTDHHLLVEEGHVRVTTGPKENRFRPAIDPLFRSAALAYGPRVIGVLLSGGLSDGTAGLAAIKARGGLALVQDPQEAAVASMPQSALATVAVDYCAPVVELGTLLVRLTHESIKEDPSMATTDALQIETQIARGANALQSGVLRLGTPSLLTCPECHGTLLQLHDQPLARFRCHTGHAYTLASLVSEVTESVEATLWNGIRILEEQHLVLLQLAEQVVAQDAALAAQLQHEAQAVAQRAQLIRQAIVPAAEGKGSDGSA